MASPSSKRSEFLRHTLQLVVGTSVAQGLVFLMQPVLSRLFTASDYALYGLFVTILSWLEIISTGRYELATVIPENDGEALNLVAGSTIFAAGISVIVFIIVFYFNPFIVSIFKLPELSSFLYLIPWVLLIWSAGKMLNSWLIRKESFRASSVNKIVQKGGEQLTSASLGLISTPGGLILGDFTGRTLMLAISVWQCMRNGASATMISVREMGKTLWKFRKYPFYNTLPAVLNTSATLLPVFYISSRFPGNDAGNFIFSRMILLLPISFLAYSISQVLLQKVSKNRINRDSVRPEIYFLFKYLGIIGLGIIILVIALGPWIFTVIFGKQWILAGIFSRIMVISYAVQFVVSPLSTALAAMEKIKIYSFWQVGYFLAIGSLYFLKSVSITEFIWALTVTEVIFYLIYLFIIFHVVARYERSMKEDFINQEK